MQFPSAGIAATRYDSHRARPLMLEMVRKHTRFFLGTALAGLALRLLLVFRWPAVVDDSRLYADIAKNWLQHGVYGITNSGTIMPTLSRLPGYPASQAAFLLAALCPFLANYAAAALTETLEIFFTALALELACRALNIGGISQ